MNRCGWLLTIVVFLLVARFGATVGTAQDFPLGTNLGGINDWDTEVPFVDAFKSSRPWFSGTDATWDDGRALSLDAHGWVRSLQAGQMARTLMFWDIHPHYPGGRYTLLYDGEGTWDYSSNVQVVESSQGRQVVQVTNTGDVAGVGLYLRTVNPANYMRNIRFLLPGNDSDAALFNPVFLDRIRNYQTLRFMNWMLGENEELGATQVHWSDRPKLDDARWSDRGLPVEVMVSLANRLHANPWFSIPHQADDDYVRQFALTVHQQLDSGLTVYLEYSNEVWNDMFPQATYAREQGTRLQLSNDAREAQLRFYARRARQVFGIFEPVIPSNRLVRVLASQSSVTWVSETELGFEDTRAHTDALAIAPYWGLPFDDQGRVLTMTVDQILDSLRDTALPHILDEERAQAAVARTNGLTLIAYEGAQDLLAKGQYSDNQTINSLFDQANRSPRMGALYDRWLAEWGTAGGGLLVHYENCAAYTQYGRWGSLEYIDQPRAQAPKYDALQRYIEQHQGGGSRVVDPVLTGPAPGSTLTAATVPFTWSAGTGVSRYWLYVGSTPGGSDLFNQDAGASLSLTVIGLPADGRRLYVRLWYLRNGVWLSADSVLTAATLAAVDPAMTSPVPGSTLSSPTAALAWRAGTGVSRYWLYVGSTPGGADLFNQDAGASLSLTVHGLPTDGRNLYVRLWYLRNGAWSSVDSTLTAATIAVADPAVTSPADGSVLGSTSVPFTWSAGTGVSRYWLWIGSTPGGSGLFNRDMGMSLSVTVEGLPTDGGVAYVRLWFLRSGSWLHADSTVRAMTGADAPAVTSPAAGTTLAGATSTITWSAAAGVSRYWVWMGSARGGYELFNRDMGTGLSVTVDGLPTDGRTLYLRLWYLAAGSWHARDYSYQAASR